MKARLGTLFACVALFAASCTAAQAAVPVAAINNCDTAVAAVGASLTTLARAKLDLAAAKSAGRAAAIKRAKLRLANATAARDAVRAKLKTYCGAGALSASAGGCPAAIDRLAIVTGQLAAARERILHAARKGRGKLRAKIAQLELAVTAADEAMRISCTPPKASEAPLQLPAGPTTPVVLPDTTPPVVTIAVKTPTNDTTPAVTLAAGEPATFSCAIDGGVSSATAAAFDLPALSEGAHSLACRGTDAANNTGPETVKQIVIDLTAPTAPLVPAFTISHILQQSFPVSPQASGDVAECRVDSGAYAVAPNYSFDVTLTLGLHHVFCRLTDAAGNVGPDTDDAITILP